MATQHPDNATASPFSGNRFISTREEIEECALCFSELGVHEYMWDWEGKFVDEAVMDRLFQNHFEFFKKNQIGRDVFLTFRIPNIWEEKAHHRLQRSFMNLISAEHAANNCGFHSPPLFEIILPMTTRADQLIHLQKVFSKIAQAAASIFDMESVLKRIDIIPLFEEVGAMADSDAILQEYVDFLQEEYNYKPEYMRVFIARSDPAMNAGLLPTMLAVKHALNNYHAFGKKNGIKIYPWIGGGSLPFRGGINPENKEACVDEYKGTASVTIQSAFRFDYPLQDVKDAIAYFNEEIPKRTSSYTTVSEEEGKRIKMFNEKAGALFRQNIEPLAPIINTIADHLPSHRERVQHVGLFGYSRGVGAVKLPRAIKFTGAFYSLGVPPEFIAMGRGLKMAQEMGMMDLVEKFYLNLRRDLVHAGKYLNRENLELLVQMDNHWQPILEDIRLIESTLGIELGPETDQHFLHRNFTSNIFRKYRIGRDFNSDILAAAELRKSLG